MTMLVRPMDSRAYSAMPSHLNEIIMLKSLLYPLNRPLHNSPLYLHQISLIRTLYYMSQYPPMSCGGSYPRN